LLSRYRLSNCKIRVIFSVRFERGKVDKKQTYVKTETCKLYSSDFEYFCQIPSKSILTISSYTISKFGRFFETQCSNIIIYYCKNRCWSIFKFSHL